MEVKGRKCSRFRTRDKRSSKESSGDTLATSQRGKFQWRHLESWCCKSLFLPLQVTVRSTRWRCWAKWCVSCTRWSAFRSCCWSSSTSGTSSPCGCRDLTSASTASTKASAPAFGCRGGPARSPGAPPTGPWTTVPSCLAATWCAVIFSTSSRWCATSQTWDKSPSSFRTTRRSLTRFWPGRTYCEKVRCSEHCPVQSWTACPGHKGVPYGTSRAWETVWKCWMFLS